MILLQLRRWKGMDAMILAWPQIRVVCGIFQGCFSVKMYNIPCKTFFLRILFCVCVCFMQLHMDRN